MGSRDCAFRLNLNVGSLSLSLSLSLARALSLSASTHADSADTSSDASSSRPALTDVAVCFCVLFLFASSFAALAAACSRSTNCRTCCLVSKKSTRSCGPATSSVCMSTPAPPRMRASEQARKREGGRESRSSASRTSTPVSNEKRSAPGGT